MHSQGDPTLILSLLEASGLERKSAAPALEEEVTVLFDQNRAPLLRYLFTLGLTAQDAEEVAQEVFLALFQHLRQGKPRTNLRAWIFRVGHHQALKLRGKMPRSVTLESDEVGQHDPTPNPEEQLATQQRQARLMAVVQAMPAQDRACGRHRGCG